jgi:hypothetical protein
MEFLLRGDTHRFGDGFRRSGSNYGIGFGRKKAVGRKHGDPLPEGFEPGGMDM